jgi:hypothetical protein
MQNEGVFTTRFLRSYPRWRSSYGTGGINASQDNYLARGVQATNASRIPAASRAHRADPRWVQGIVNGLLLLRLSASREVQLVSSMQQRCVSCVTLCMFWVSSLISARGCVLRAAHRGAHTHPPDLSTQNAGRALAELDAKLFNTNHFHRYKRRT